MPTAPEWREASWSAPALWRFGRRRDGGGSAQSAVRIPNSALVTALFLNSFWDGQQGKSGGERARSPNASRGAEMPELLEKEFHQRVSIEGIENHKIQFGTLLSAVAHIRYEQQIEDVNQIIKSCPPGEEDPEKLGVKYGKQLQSYIYEDMFCSERSGEEILNRTMIFTSLARAYCRRISKVYFSAIP